MEILIHTRFEKTILFPRLCQGPIKTPGLEIKTVPCYIQSIYGVACLYIISGHDISLFAEITGKHNNNNKNRKECHLRNQLNMRIYYQVLTIH